MGRTQALLGDRLRQAGHRHLGRKQEDLKISLSRHAVWRVASDATGTWVEFDVSGWRIRKIASGSMEAA